MSPLAATPRLHAEGDARQDGVERTRTLAELAKRGADAAARATSGADGRAQPGGAPGQRAQAPRDHAA